jgi:hypothetical protein
LNPARAGLIGIGKEPLKGCRCSSYASAKREHGEQAAERLLQAGSVALGLTAEELWLRRRVTA